MHKIWWLTLVLLLFSSSLSAKEYYFRLDSGVIILIVTSDDISLTEALASGEYESSFSSNFPESNHVENLPTDDNLSELLGLHAISSVSHINQPQNSNVIELINICEQPVIGEEFFAHKCAIPTCKRRFESTRAVVPIKKTDHHRSHFTPEFLNSLKGQLVVCPFCHSSMTGILSVIIMHFSRYCPGS